jgi:hypothetical protein
MGAGMGGGGHANNPAFMFQSDWAKNSKWPASREREPQSCSLMLM